MSKLKPSTPAPEIPLELEQLRRKLAQREAELRTVRNQLAKITGAITTTLGE